MTDDLAATLRETLARLEAAGIAYMVVGSMAALAHGRSRATQDFDVVIEADRDRLKRFLASLESDRYYASEEAALDALARQAMFNVIDLATGWKIALVIRKNRPFSKAEFARRRSVPLLSLEVYVASIEDTILSKLEWSKLGGGSERQREDVRALLESGVTIDRVYIDEWVKNQNLDDEWRHVSSSPERS